MGGVDEVRAAGANKLFWKVRIAGKEKQWEAEITEQVPNERIVWKSMEGAANRGAVIFEPVSVGKTRVTLIMEYEPEGFIEHAGDALGIPLGQVAEDLGRFRDLMEKGKDETDTRGGEAEQVQTPASISRGDAEDGANVANWTERHSVSQNRGSPEIVVSGTIATENEQISDVSAASRDKAIHQEEHVPEMPVGSEAGTNHDSFHGIEFETKEQRFVSGAPTVEEIARRAYEIYLERGEKAGNPHEDWLAAERELTEKSSSENRH
jgi:hypothetical protein